jgi:fatty acid desaturase
MIALAFFVLARWPQPLTFLLALVVIAGRQLGLAILQHEASHHSLFKTKWLNDVLTDWLCARPVWQNLKKYREHHMRHHTHTGSDDDPDLTLHDGFPTTRRSLFRKFARDLIGYTGLKTILGLILMDAGVLRWTVANDIERLPQDGRRWYDYPLDFLRNAGGMLITNAVLFALLWATGNPWLYGVWVLAYITPFPFFIRIRSIAEHACRPKVRDTFENTRSIRANWFWRLTVAPNRVNYHREHHLLSAVPYYRLPMMHRMLREKGLVEEPPSYISVLKQASAGA